MLVAIYAPPGADALELAAAGEVFALVNKTTRSLPRYDVRIIAETTQPQRSSSGLRFVPDLAVGEARDPADLLIVASGQDWNGRPPPATIAWLRRQADTAERYGSFGTGAFALGAAGLLDGRRVTTHWACSAALSAAWPAARVEPDRIHVRDGRLFSGAGGAAAIDLVLALVEEDHGREISLALARELVLFMRRSGAQAQVSVQLALQTTTRDSIQRAMQHVRDDIAGDLSVTSLAAAAAMSPRNFARVFHQQTGTRPADYVEQTRVNLAKRMIEETALSLQEVARLCGFSGTEAARRAFRRQVGQTMGDYRAGLDGRQSA